MSQSKGRIVIALGGNALQDAQGPATAEAQLHVVKKTCQYIAAIIKDGYEVIIVHGNGPQVGRILLASETAREVTPTVPFDVCGAMSQGYIGYHIQQGMRKALKELDINIPVVTIVTQLVVSADDPAFANPTKPIGPYYSAEEAQQLAAEKGYTMKEDPAGRGWRRVVASPVPIKIVEIDSVINACNNAIVITCGGGGIPVIEDQSGDLLGIAAVIDKDYAAELLAEELHADMLMILTEVDKVSLNFNKPNQQDLDRVTVAQAEQYIAEGHFPPGSMLPKMTAAIKFVKTNPGKEAIITSLYHAGDALAGKTGTKITL